MMLGSEAKTQIQEILDLILLGDEVCSAVKQAKSFMEECGELRKRVSQLVEMLETLFCFITSFDTALYLRPVKCVVPKVKDNFKHALDIVNKCQNQSFICRVIFTCSNATQFRNLFQLLDASIMDMQCLVTVYDLQKEAIDPRIKKSPAFLVWSFIASVQMGRQLGDRVDAAKNLALLAQEKEEYKEIIFEEGGVPPLLKLFKKTSSPDAQITVANALCLLANDEERTEIIMKEMISAIVNRLSRTSPVMDQIQAANLVAGIAKNNAEVKEYDLMRENVIWRLITLLSSEPSTDDHRPSSCQLKLKISCSKALLMLASGSVKNCRTLTETKGMLCLAKLVQTERDELQYNCLMIIREITDIAESNDEFRRSAFKSTSPAAKAVVDELLRVIKEFDEAKLRIPAIKSIGSLARSFSAKERRVISPLVAQLDNADQQITTEAAVALNKFVCSENHLSEEHSKSIVEFGGVPLLMKLISNGDKKMAQPHGLALICYLAKHGGNSNVLIKAGALAALETTGFLVVAEHPELEELVSEAITKLQSDQTEDPEEFDGPSKGSIKQFIREQSKVVSDFLRHPLKLVLEGPIIYLPRLVSLQIVRTTSEIVMRCEKRFLQAQRCFPTRRIKQFLEPHSLELALRSVMDYPGPRVVAKEITGKLKEVKKIVKSFRKKEIRRKFGYIVHKFRFWKIVTCSVILPWLI
ncbi:hypothetical protein PTKIN_Ptkin10aG0187100 [Pterospermum kingtungense]